MDKSKYAIIHIVVKELGLTDNEYRDTLEKICGVRSSKLLDDKQFKKLLRYFVKSKYYKNKKDGISYKQRSYINLLKKELKWEESHLKNFIIKYYHKKEINELSKKDAIKLIESLKNIKNRKKD